MTPTQVADYVADYAVNNLSPVQSDIEEFTVRLNTRIDALPDEVQGWIFDAIEAELNNVVCKKHPT